MSWPCRLVEYTGGPFPDQVGDMWFVRPEDIHTIKSADPHRDGRLSVMGYILSDEYLAERRAHRLPLFVRLPGRAPMCFCIDSAVSDETRGWTVTGEAPNITVSPSINIVGLWHGFLTSGILTDDLDSRG